VSCIAQVTTGVPRARKQFGPQQRKPRVAGVGRRQRFEVRLELWNSNCVRLDRQRAAEHLLEAVDVVDVQSYAIATEPSEPANVMHIEVIIYRTILYQD